MLVQQFSQPLAFLRELVQNSLDARSNRIDITVEQDQDDLACICVKDTGEGMDRHIIDRRLTRLFASDKENDLTKVGKFGIGFVSVFAVKPEAVVVDTGRDGENWRLVFHPDRTFDRIVLKETLEGCRVSVYLQNLPHQLADLQRRCRETVSYWCRHCHAEIYFNGQQLNQSFQFEDGFQVHQELAGTRMVVKAVAAKKPFFGFYNKGLTLLEGWGTPAQAPAGFAFKLDSRYLEHTLTRDNIIEDDHYQKAMMQLEAVVESRFPQELATHLSTSPTPEGWQACALITKSGGSLSPHLRGCAMWPVHTRGGVTHTSYSELTRQARVLHAEQTSALVEALVNSPDPPLLLQGGPSSPWWAALRAAGIDSVEVCQTYCLAEKVSADPDLVAPLLEAAGRLLEVQDLWAGRWISPPASRPGKGNLSTRYPYPGRPQVSGAAEKGKPKLMVDVEHPSWAQIVRIAAHDHPLAVSLMAQRIVLEQGWVSGPRVLASLLEGGLRLRR